ncbi:MAG: anti-sigma factor antagonist [Acidimicrobiaceae bacterium]|jgi:anti-sigma B factor antagonist|nr:anti-sigma factor antagonist [Acidimicrobiaceae bacterium]MDQ1446401.1 anti-sigma factor antagonist [Acidimicrobiaceae bacterium]
MDEFGIEVGQREGCTVVAVRGEVDLATAPALKNCLLDLVAGGVTEIVVDLSSTDFLDSTGLGAVVAAYKRVRVHEGHLKLVATSARVKRVFEITNLDRVVPICATVEEACAAFG